MKSAFRRALLALVCLGLATAASAQTRPTAIEFGASADHDSTASPIASYALELSENGVLVFPRKDLGKPTPDATGKIGPLVVAEFANLAAGPFGNPRQYVAVVVAIGPGGEVKSDASDPFPLENPPGRPRKSGKPALK